MKSKARKIQEKDTATDVIIHHSDVSKKGDSIVETHDEDDRDLFQRVERRYKIQNFSFRLHFQKYSTDRTSTDAWNYPVANFDEDEFVNALYHKIVDHPEFYFEVIGEDGKSQRKESISLEELSEIVSLKKHNNIAVLKDRNQFVRLIRRNFKGALMKLYIKLNQDFFTRKADYEAKYVKGGTVKKKVIEIAPITYPKDDRIENKELVTKDTKIYQSRYGNEFKLKFAQWFCLASYIRKNYPEADPNSIDITELPLPTTYVFWLFPGPSPASSQS